jgi:hypothetical protein
LNETIPAPAIIGLTDWCVRGESGCFAPYVPPGTGWVHALDNSSEPQVVEMSYQRICQGRRFQAQDGQTYELCGPPMYDYLNGFARPGRMWFLAESPFEWVRLGWFKWQLARLCAAILHLGAGIH